MTQPPDYTDLAKHYLDFWQDHWAQMATDPNWLQMVQQAGTHFAASAPAGMGGMGGGMGGMGGGMGSGFSPAMGAKNTSDDPTPRPAPAAPAPDHNAAVLAQLIQRLFTLEARVAMLESERAAHQPR